VFVWLQGGLQDQNNTFNPDHESTEDLLTLLFVCRLEWHLLRESCCNCQCQQGPALNSTAVVMLCDVGGEFAWKMCAVRAAEKVSDQPAQHPTRSYTIQHGYATYKLKPGTYNQLLFPDSLQRASICL